MAEAEKRGEDRNTKKCQYLKKKKSFFHKVNSIFHIFQVLFRSEMYKIREQRL